MNRLPPVSLGLRSFWKNWGVAAFCGIAFGLGYSAARHSTSMLAWAGFGILLGLLGSLLEAVRGKAMFSSEKTNPMENTSESPPR